MILRPALLSVLALSAASCGPITRSLGEADAGTPDAGPSPDLGAQDTDGDGIVDAIEIGPVPTLPADSDHDGLPDYRDLDSDADTISDRDETAADRDQDGLANYVDTDSDDDGVLDAIEAGDGDLSTPPARCAFEVDPATRLPMRSDGSAYAGDAWSDWLDTDSDNDGLSDTEEKTLGTSPCALDTDGDGVDDAFEGAYSEVNCPGGTPIDAAHASACDAATNPRHTIPATDFYLVLPYGAPAVTRPLEFGTSLRVADVFFLTDTTAAMGGTIDNVRSTIESPGGLIDRIASEIPDASFGAGSQDDLPFNPYGTFGDEPFALLAQMGDVSAPAVSMLRLHDGSDVAGAQSLALWELATGGGGTWHAASGASYTMPDYAGRCPSGTWGAACFRSASLPIVVHFTNGCSHQGPPGESSLCAAYAGVTADTPASVPTWDDVTTEMRRVGMKYVGINTSSTACAGPTAPDGTSPCYFLRRTAEVTGSVDVDGSTLVFDLPDGSDTTVFTDTVVGAVERLATRVPYDVDTTVHGLPAPFGVVTSAFVRSREPGCSAPAPDTLPTCWVEPPGVTHDRAVARVDTSTFFGVVPGTRVTFQIKFQNDSFEGQADSSSVFVASIDVRAAGATVVDTRQVFIVIPAKSDPFG